MTASSPTARLSRSFDVSRLLADLEVCWGFPWTLERYYDSDSGAMTAHENWWILPLRSRGGRPDDSTGGLDSFEPYADTPFLRQTPYFRELLQGLGCPLRSVRLSALSPGAVILEHADSIDSLEGGGDIRLHVPITTNDGVRFVLGGEPMSWLPGQLWYGDFSKLHSVENQGTTARVHLLICAGVSRTLLDLFPPPYLASRSIRNLPRPFDPRPELEFEFSVDTSNPQLRETLSLLPERLRHHVLELLGRRMRTRCESGRLVLAIGSQSYSLDSIEDGYLKVADLPVCLEYEVRAGVILRATLRLTLGTTRIELPMSLGSSPV